MVSIKAAFLLSLLVASGFKPMVTRRLSREKQSKVKQGLRIHKATPAITPAVVLPPSGSSLAPGQHVTVEPLDPRKSNASSFLEDSEGAPQHGRKARAAARAAAVGAVALMTAPSMAQQQPMDAFARGLQEMAGMAAQLGIIPTFSEWQELAGPIDQREEHILKEFMGTPGAPMGGGGGGGMGGGVGPQFDGGSHSRRNQDATHEGSSRSQSQGRRRKAAKSRRRKSSHTDMLKHIRARERLRHLVNEGMTFQMAQQVVMNEFANEFGSSRTFLPPPLPLEQAIENDMSGNVLESLKQIPGLVYLGGNKVVFPNEYCIWKRISFKPDPLGDLLKALINEAGAVHLGGPNILVPGKYLQMKFKPDDLGDVFEALHKEVEAVDLGGSRILVPRQYIFGPPQAIVPDTSGDVVRGLRRAGCSYLGGAQVLLPHQFAAWRRVPFQPDILFLGFVLRELKREGALYLGGNKVLMP